MILKKMVENKMQVPQLYIITHQTDIFEALPTNMLKIKMPGKSTREIQFLKDEPKFLQNCANGVATKC